VRQGFAKDLPIDEVAWDLAQQAQSAGRSAMAVRADGESDRRTVEEVVVSEARACVSALLDDGGPVAAIVAPVANAGLGEDAPGSVLQRLEVASKIMAIHDQLIDSDTRVLLSSKLPTDEAYDDRGFGELSVLEQDFVPLRVDSAA
jgi:hypothetical protein